MKIYHYCPACDVLVDPDLPYPDNVVDIENADRNPRVAEVECFDCWISRQEALTELEDERQN